MNSFRKRVQKLEAQFTKDQSGFAPHSPQWCAYWGDWLARLARGEKPPGCLPIEVYREMVSTAAADRPR
jgi:hypothetical protein